MIYLFYWFLAIAVPAGLITWFIWALVSYCRTPKEDVEKRNTRRLLWIIPAGVLTLLLAAFIGLVILFAIAITHM